MTRLFGIPMGILAVFLVATLVAALAAVAVVAARNRVFLRLGIRNAERRPGRNALIVIGLMLGTAIIAAALGGVLGAKMWPSKKDVQREQEALR